MAEWYEINSPSHERRPSSGGHECDAPTVAIAVFDGVKG
jgi:hypothetical protein